MKHFTFTLIFCCVLESNLGCLLTDTMTWMQPATTGQCPSARAGHTCTALGTKLFVWGGGDGEHYLNDLHILDTETMQWSQAYSRGSSPW